MLAVTFELDTKVVVRALPFQFTTAPETNPVPFTVRVNVAAPGAFCPGDKGALISGSGFVASAEDPNANTIVTITARVEKLLRRCEMVPSRKVMAGCRQVFTRYLPLFFL
jgi:hypothetical protein